MHVLHVVGARPNFMKAAPVIAALKGRDVRQTLVHTGQHYDAAMSDVFFEQLGLPEPDVNLGTGSGTHARQTADIMIGLEPVILGARPELVAVYGDVNSTVAATLVCAKLRVPVAHVEAGLRSFDRSMPEEINRLVTDQLADLLLTPSADGDENLLREGVAPERIHCVGNVMIDTLVRLLPRARGRTVASVADLDGQPYALVTLHRPSNVDEPQMLAALMKTLGRIGRDITVVFPVHPRTRARIAADSLDISSGVRLLEPLGYLDFLALQTRALVLITDSGGIQEETTFLGIPCLTVRENTERPITTTLGTNLLVGQDTARLEREVLRILSGNIKLGTLPPLWDGHAAERIADIIAPAFSLTSGSTGSMHGVQERSRVSAFEPAPAQLK